MSLYDRQICNLGIRNYRIPPLIMGPTFITSAQLDCGGGKAEPDFGRGRTLAECCRQCSSGGMASIYSFICDGLNPPNQSMFLFYLDGLVFSPEANTVLAPCGHNNICYDSAALVYHNESEKMPPPPKYPFCREEITQFIRLI